VTTTVDVNGHACRVWTKGKGPKLGFLAGLGGLPRWLPFLDRLAETRTVIAPSLPGYPGATGHTELDTHLDWVMAVRQLVDKAGLAGADLVGASVGGAFAAEMAAIFPGKVGRLVLIAPFGLFDDREPAADPWALRKNELPGAMCADAANWDALVAPPEGAKAARQHAAREAARSDRGADPRPVGRARRHSAAELCEQVRDGDQRLEPGRNRRRSRASGLSRPARRGRQGRPGPCRLNSA
jgi:pimeloyl-ACP methyl ester carboxylesterase